MQDKRLRQRGKIILQVKFHVLTWKHIAVSRDRQLGGKPMASAITPSVVSHRHHCS